MINKRTNLWAESFFGLVIAHFWLDIYSVKISEIGVNLDNPPKTITWRRISKHYCRHRRRFLHVYSWISLTSQNCFGFKQDHLKKYKSKKKVLKDCYGMKKRNNDGKRGKTKNIKYMERALIQDVHRNLAKSVEPS